MKRRTQVLLTGLLLYGGVGYSGPQEQARLMYNRLTGVPPTAAVMQSMMDLITQGKPADAAKIAMSQPAFFTLKLKNILNKWTNKDFATDVPLNDMTATMIGMIRDDVPFNLVLTEDIIYVADDALVTAGTVPAFDFNTNAQYIALDDKAVDLQRGLVRKTQSEVNDLPASAISGVLSLRTFADHYYSAGTNRRANEAIMNNFLCRTMDQLSDTIVPDFMVRRDVDRSPGGDSNVFKNKCVGCHAGQDAMAGWTAYYNYDMTANRLVFTDGVVQDKMNINANVFPDGRQVVDDGWRNLWTAGQNATLGWQGEQSGNGARSFGAMVARTDAFSICMANKVFQEVCLRSPTSSDDNTAVAQMALKFMAGGKYNMKDLFAETAVLCLMP